MGRLLRACAERRFVLIFWAAIALAAGLPFVAASPRPATAATVAAPPPRTGLAAAPMPVISRDLPTHAVDADYATGWRPGVTRSWLAIDLATVAAARRGDAGLVRRDGDL